MVQNFSLHMHTIGFDGQHSIEEMASTAKEKGFEKIGISNHFIVYPGIKKTNMYQAALKRGYQSIYSASFEEAVQKFKLHYKEIDEISQKTGIPIYKGMEADFFRYEGWRDGFEDACRELKPDYIIGAAHFVEYKNTLYNSHDLKKATTIEQNMLLYKYYQNIRAAAKSGLFDFFAHLDLMKKVGLGLEERWYDVEKQTVEAMAAANAVAEINTSGFARFLDEAYPSNRILKLFAAYDIPVLISDDAHAKERIGDMFEKAEAIAHTAGIKKFCDPLYKKENFWGRFSKQDFNQRR